MIDIINNRIEFHNNGEVLIIEAWGKNSVRVRSFPNSKVLPGDGALNNKVSHEAQASLINDDEARLINGKIEVLLDHRNRLTFKNSKGQVLLKEFVRQRAVKNDDGSEDINNVTVTADFNSTLKLAPREFKANVGGDYELFSRFESGINEHIYGMGQYQHPYLDLKYTKLELAQRNSQTTVPFYLSSLGYGFLWNNPGIGTVDFAKNITLWHLPSTDRLDYWVTAGDTPQQIERQYADVTGKVPQMPRNLLGLWQSKLRYQTDQEVLQVVDKYKAKKIPLSTIVIDFFHWPYQGDYCFDSQYWKNPLELSKKLKKLGVTPIVSVWPTIEKGSKNYNKFQELGLLVKERRGVKVAMQTQSDTNFIDMTNPLARREVWKLLHDNYLANGYDTFWLDVAEPGYAVYDYDNYHYYEGTDLCCGNIFPDRYLKMIFKGLVDAGHDNVVTLVRSAWAGSQKYGALLWSGDIDASFKALRNQVNTGLNVGIAGIPWWTTDIGGFHGGNPKDPDYQELMTRWFEYATFSPVLRMHGFRQPHDEPLASSGGGAMASGAGNEVWSYGSKTENILVKYIKIRENLKDYIAELMEQAHKFGDPIMRPIFYHFPNDSNAWTDKGANEYLFGEELLIAPIIYPQQVKRELYLPAGETWYCFNDSQMYQGGQNIVIEAPLDQIPLFCRKRSKDKFKELIKL
ncbi:Glycosyl hydrolase, family 31 [Bombilactobacillus mellis]|uniref:Glycosyl hydrolase, family 31 n=1 Tax=Bombilactobacillus mellis TaxID=1218508 RepID=A0A0F4KQF8_9LACO|nr:TIM-barrel domain-containing protein [Bombilactobacillus mellis]KJY48298.1 Glycosyl hydrolase, family 31 [Bombilactobacillus mellis]